MLKEWGRVVGFGIGISGLFGPVRRAVAFN